MSNAGGTLTLPSPTHAHHHHVDVGAGLRSLRRSLSRSPSKFSLARTSSQSSSDTGSTPSSPSLRRVQSQYFGPTPSNPFNLPPNSLQAQSPLATPFRPSVKLSLRSAKSSKSPAQSSTATKQLSRIRTSPRSPSRRALSSVTTSGNSAPSSSSILQSTLTGQENVGVVGARSPAATRRSSDKASNRHSMHLDMSGASPLALSRFAESSGSNMPGSIVSPLKRSDATMSLDQTVSSSPKAKRRSCGPSNMGEIFGHGSPSTSPDAQDDSAREYDWTSSLFNTSEPLPSPTPSVVPRRAGSLRKSTLQQRHSSERRSWGRREGAMQLAQSTNEATTPMKNRPRLSMDAFMPPPSRDSPFNTQGPLPNPSAHTLNGPAHQPHPLSRQMTTSSSSSSIGDDSPTHFPIQHERPRAPINFSKSLPLGASRPRFERQGEAVASVSTPDYKYAKPFEGAFASTGLVSKMHKIPDTGLSGAGFGVAAPDTPCKKPSHGGFNTYPPIPPSGSAKARGRHIRHTFGDISTPFNGSATRLQNTFGEQTRPIAFNGFKLGHTRRGSLLSLYSDEGASPSKNVDDLLSMDTEIPPTPTKQQLLNTSTTSLTDLSSESPTTNRYLPATTSALGNKPSWQHDSEPNCEYSPFAGPPDGRLEQDAVAIRADASEPQVPVITATPTVASPLPSFSQSRAKHGSLSTPAPLETATKLIKSSTKVQFAKYDTENIASPLDRLEFAEKASPRTPVDSAAPLDASRLTISNPSEAFVFPATGNRKSVLPPATPTTRHGNFQQILERRVITPVHGASAHDLDGPLCARFGKVDLVGKGEFSSVYKVTAYAKPSFTVQTSFFDTPVPAHVTPPSASAGQVYAVKKLNMPFQSDRDRTEKMREVSALQALRGCDHVLQLIDSWEDNGSLYIQTEFCEEGNLDKFLSEVGVKGRLDDFRIWKVMLEINMGLKHIHDAGLVHLDLKPSNILVGFDGGLKIADFGLATSANIRGEFDFEGDREYLAPEVLRSDITPAADVFSLGLIMLEIAANVKLPENGATWTALREGDFSEVPILTEGGNSIVRDAEGLPIEDAERLGQMSDDDSSTRHIRKSYNFRNVNRQSGDIFGLNRNGSVRKTELQQPPEFMGNPDHSSSLDNVVKAMLAAVPSQRPCVSQLFELDALAWVAARQRAGATVFEGNWGPADDVVEPISLDTEMTDV